MLYTVLASAVLSLFVLATEARSALEARSSGHALLGRSPHKRTLTGQVVAFACIGGGGDCECPIDNNGDSGVLIHVFPGYQCSYPNGSCQWDDITGALQNTGQSNCPDNEPCSTDAGCICPNDLTGAPGVLIHQFTGYQCSYNGGACTWDVDGNLQNPQQGNCPGGINKCKQSGIDS